MNTKYDFSKFLGLEFNHGVQDCYTMVRMIYKDLLGIELRDYVRPTDWWLYDFNLYVDNFKKEGFKQLPEDYDLGSIRLFDVFLVAIPDPRGNGVTPPNHCAIYIGDGNVIHHRLGRLSEIKAYNGALRNFTTHILRHRNVNINTPKENIDIRDYLLPSKRRLLEDE